ncbi:hypothetical protein TNCV_1968081 [Trichonephila clavipes]|nr:hypothetical protein TNCV_1968081 [Trichonephila clavipes]
MASRSFKTSLHMKEGSFWVPSVPDAIASTLLITPKRSSSRDVGTSSYRYHNTTYSPASVLENRRTNDTIFVFVITFCGKYCQLSLLLAVSLLDQPEAFYGCKQKTNNQCGEDTLTNDTTITRGAIETITQPSTFITRDSSTKWQICDPRSNNVRPTYEILAIQTLKIMQLRQFRINVRFQPFA